VALIVPCHRVVRADGTTGGYHWGAERKEALLSHERARQSEGTAAAAGRRAGRRV
jgi:alkylated DNA nucleotide flippase Atl1